MRVRVRYTSAARRESFMHIQRICGGGRRRARARASHYDYNELAREKGNRRIHEYGERACFARYTVHGMDSYARIYTRQKFRAQRAKELLRPLTLSATLAGELRSSGSRVIYGGLRALWRASIGNIINLPWRQFREGTA